MGLAHVTIPTTAFDTTVHFLEQVLEFPRIEHPEGIPMQAAWFEVAENQQLHVLEVDGLKQPENDREFGRHVAFKFPYARWLRIRNRLEENNSEIVPPQRESNVSRFFAFDPNGYCFEFVRDSGR